MGGILGTPSHAFPHESLPPRPVGQPAQAPPPRALCASELGLLPLPPAILLPHSGVPSSAVSSTSHSGKHPRLVLPTRGLVGGSLPAPLKHQGVLGRHRGLRARAALRPDFSGTATGWVTRQMALPSHLHLHPVPEQHFTLGDRHLILGKTQDHHSWRYGLERPTEDITFY